MSWSFVSNIASVTDLRVLDMNQTIKGEMSIYGNIYG